MMDNTKIDWADMTWNPVTGCRHGCEYCYAARTAGRFAGYLSQGVKVFNDTRKEEIVQEVKKPNCEREGIVVLDKPLKTMTAAGNVVNAPYPFGFTPTFHRYRLGDPARKQRPRNIFVCSMADLFGAWVPTKWIMEVLDACLAAPQHNYLFLTKNPRRYTELDEMALLPRRDNFWYGTTTTEDGARVNFDSKKEARRYDELMAMLRANQIRELKLQPQFTIQEAYTTPEGVRVRAIRYQADFSYERPTEPDCTGEVHWLRVVEDVKSRATKTRVYEIKKKLLREKLGVEIREV